MPILLTILSVIFVAGFIVLMITAIRVNLRCQRELSYDTDVYDGPAGEPQWDGKLPAKVDDYTEPRYVYENLIESTDFLPENGRIIGYRISPSLVIHSRTHPAINPPVLWDYIERFGGKLLQDEEIWLLQDNWSEISKLREKAGDEPLEPTSFWAQFGAKPVAYQATERCYKDVISFSDSWHALILKR